MSDLPVFVTVLKRQSSQGAELDREVAALANAIAQVIGRSISRVHIEYAPAAAGRLAFGGRLVQCGCCPNRGSMRARRRRVCDGAVDAIARVKAVRSMAFTASGREEFAHEVLAETDSRAFRRTDA
jgi:hypothetical protein